jgi:hypothetical protein
LKKDEESTYCCRFFAPLPAFGGSRRKSEMKKEGINHEH